MTTFYSLDSANGRIPEVREILLVLRDQRVDLVRMRDRLIELNGDAAPSDEAADGARHDRAGSDWTDALREQPASSPTVAPQEETRLIRLRMQGVIDQMQASVAKLDTWGITLRDIGTGLIDFPALASGRQIWLCWRLGENDIDWWHGLDEGFAGRRHLADLV